MPLQGEYEPSSSKWVRDQVAEYESSGGTKGTKLRGVPVVVITSLGASSGKLRKNPVMRVEHDGVYAAVASKGGAPQHPAWYRNFMEHPVVELQDEGAKRDYTAREVSGEERATWWERAVAVWPDYAEYQTKTDREIRCSCWNLRNDLRARRRIIRVFDGVWTRLTPPARPQIRQVAINRWLTS